MNKKQKLEQIKAKLKEKGEDYHKDTKSLREERDKLLTEIENEEGKKLVGKCFKFRNSYGSGEKWWLYSKIVGADSEWVNTLELQKLPFSGIEIKLNKISKSLFENGVYTSITKKEFNNVYKRFIKKIEDAKK